MPQYNDFQTWDEVLKYTFDNGQEEIFIPFIEDGYVKYHWETDPEYIINWLRVEDILPSRFNNYRIRGFNPKYPLMGPPAPELPPLIKKIRDMHMRQTFSWG